MIAAKCKRCNTIGCNGNNQLCNNKGEINNYLKTNFTTVYEGLYKSRNKWLGAGTGDDKSLYVDITGGDTLVYWVENRGFETTIFEGREIKSVEEFEQLFYFLDIFNFISRQKEIKTEEN